MTSTLTMEVLALKHAIKWLASSSDALITHAIILPNSMKLQQKVGSEMGCPDWHTAIHSLWLQRSWWVYCPRHAGIRGNEWANTLASMANITSGLQLSRNEVLKGLRNFQNMGRLEHHSTDCLKVSGVEKGSGQHSILQSQRSVINHTSTGSGTVSRAT